MSILHETLYNVNFSNFLTTLTEARLKIENHNTYNIFRVLRMETDETYLHSAFLADLLNPKGFHNHGDVFLNLFICKMGLGDSSDIKNTHVKVEYTIDKVTIDKDNPENSKGGRIDILINNWSGSSFIIAIENKIYAEDQLHQIIRYHNFLKKEKYSQKRLIYLTLFGDSPSELSVGNVDTSFFKDTNLMNISYESDIISWLDKCIMLCKDTSVRDAIGQYKNVVERLVKSSIINIIRSQGMNENSKISESLFNTENLRTIKKIYQEYNAFSEAIIDNIVQNIISRLKEFNITPLDKNNSGYIRDIRINNDFDIRFKYVSNILYFGVSCKNNLEVAENTKETRLRNELERFEFKDKSSDFLCKKETGLSFGKKPLCKDIDVEIEKIVSDCANIISEIRNSPAQPRD